MNIFTEEKLKLTEKIEENSCKQEKKDKYLKENYVSKEVENEYLCEVKT